VIGAHRREPADTGAMTETESLIAEVRQLRADVARLHATHTPAHIRHGWMKLLFKDLSTNPYTQYKVHMWGAIYLLINFPLICALFFFTPTLWLKLGIFITLIYSIYANLATDYGAMSAAEAASGSRSRRRSHLSRRRRCRRRYEAAQPPGALIFPTLKGGPLHRGNFNRVSAGPRDCVDRHDLSAFSRLSRRRHNHDLRHAGNTLAGEAGAASWTGWATAPRAQR
jgi:hypothetical protein